MLKDKFIELYKQENINYYEIFIRLHDVKEEMLNLDFSMNNLESIFDFERYVIHNKGASKFKVEEKILEMLQVLIIDLCERCNFNILSLTDTLINESNDNELKKLHKINLDILNFSKEIFNISIPRDSFSSKRKGYALGLISRLLNYYEIPNKFDLFIVALQSSKDKLIIEALNELHYHYENFPDKDLSEEIINELNKIILKTKNRTVATGLLNLQVITGHISELEALSEIDDWKEKFYNN